MNTAELSKITPKADPKILEGFEQYSWILDDAGINTPQRQRHFMAQMAHESGGFKHLKELSSGSQYEGNKMLGNTKPGDGSRYKGRGLIQLTGRWNYTDMSKKLGIDLVNNPELAADPKVSMQIAARYWKDKGLNKLADKNDLNAITKRINGGYNGLKDRKRYFDLFAGVDF